MEKEDSKKKIEHQLKIIRGQIDGVIKMIDKDDDCKAIMSQSSAINQGCKRVMGLLVQKYISECIRNNKEENLDELVKTMTKFI